MAVELRDIEPLRPLLAQPPLALLTDIDGTLAPIVPNPEDARVTDRTAAALNALADRHVRTAFVTGRSLIVARAMIHISGAAYAANHGLTLLTGSDEETPREVRPYVELARKTIRELGSIPVPGVLVEDKGPIIALHYRKANSDAEALAAIESAIAGSPAAREFTVHRGRKVIELRPPLPINKGTAASALLARMRPGVVIGMGDDTTDIDMFRVIKASRLPSATVAVANPEESGVLEAADYFVRGVEGVERLLEDLVRAIPASSG